MWSFWERPGGTELPAGDLHFFQYPFQFFALQLAAWPERLAGLAAISLWRPQTVAGCEAMVSLADGRLHWATFACSLGAGFYMQTARACGAAGGWLIVGLDTEALCAWSVAERFR